MQIKNYFQKRNFRLDKFAQEIKVTLPKKKKEFFNGIDKAKIYLISCKINERTQHEGQ
jgi:hypothetical protein